MFYGVHVCVVECVRDGVSVCVCVCVYVYVHVRRCVYVYAMEYCGLECTLIELYMGSVVL